MLASLVFSILTLQSNVHLAKATGPIYIRADGTVDPSTAPILSIDNVTYTFSDDIFDEIVIERGNIIIDGNGSLLQGSGGPSSIGFYFSGVDNVTIRNTNITQFHSGVYAERSSFYISGNEMTNNYQGIYAFYPSSATISGNKITNSRFAIFIDASSNLTVAENNIAAVDYGVVIQGFSENTVTKNNITASQGCGILFFLCTDSIISKNNIAEGRSGIELDFAENNNIFENVIAKNSYGLYITQSSNNTFYHNSFLENSQQVNTTLNSDDFYQEGYPSGGNYWSDYAGADLRSGPYQNDPGGDGIGDTWYNIDPVHRDRFPLMKPYGGPHDVAIKKIAASKTVLGEGHITNATITVLSYGITTVAVNLTVYANETTIATITNVTVASRNSTTVTFTWNTTGFAKGNYTMSACAAPSPDETDITDNSLNGSTVLIGVPSDVTGTLQGVPDGQCDMSDINYFLSRFGTTPASSNWDPNTDTTGPTPRLPDNKVNMRDIGEACSNFGATDP